jgi:hypothetical protein
MKLFDLAFKAKIKSTKKASSKYPSKHLGKNNILVRDMENSDEITKAFIFSNAAYHIKTRNKSYQIISKNTPLIINLEGSLTMGVNWYLCVETSI